MAAWQSGQGKSKPKTQALAASAAPRAMQGSRKRSPLRAMERRMRQMHGFGQEGGYPSRRGAFARRHK